MSNAIEKIKTELLKQKEAIVSKGGSVNVHAVNPTPAEITAGIEAIPEFTGAGATATAADVLQGETFYGVDGEFLTGSLDVLSQADFDLIFNNYSSVTTNIDYHIKAGTLQIRKYFLAESPTHLNLYLNDELQKINDYAFWKSSNTHIKNFTDMQNLTSIGNYSMSYLGTGLDFTTYPSSLTTVGKFAFCASHQNGQSIVLPSTITSYGEGCFSSSTADRHSLASVDLSNCPASRLAKNMFAYTLFPEFDFTTPSDMTSFPGYFMYGGGPRSITITSNVTSIAAYAFGNAYSDSAEHNVLETIVFEGTTPPTLAQNFAGPGVPRTNKSLIYVPDESVEAYTALQAMRQYSSIVKPMSEKP